MKRKCITRGDEMKVIDLDIKRENKVIRDFTSEVKELKNNPVIEMFGEKISNCAIHPQNENISVKYNPIEGKFVLDIQLDNAEDIHEIAEFANLYMQKIGKVKKQKF